MLSLTTALPNQANAEPSGRIQTRVSPACAGAALDLEPRLERALDKSLPTGLEAFVEIEESVGGYRATIATRVGSKASGAKIIDASTCDEAVDAVVAVLALAFFSQVDAAPSDASRPVFDAAPVDAPAPAASLEPSTNAASTWRAATEAPADRAATAEDARSDALGSTRASVVAGADQGTLGQPTAIVSAGVSRSLSALEVRGFVRYGLPTATETVETEFTESVRSDFGAVDLAGCYGVGASFRASACAGAEAGAVRTRRRFETREGTDVDEDAVSPRLSGTLGALFAHRGGIVEPEVELEAAAVVVGREEGASWLAVRVLAGAAVEF